MRNEFAKLLSERASSNSAITLITGDLGYGVLDDFRKQNPKQFINSGINEQAMMGMAAGMASLGLRPFVYSIGNFPTLRCLEQIRNDVCFMNNPVTIVSVGAGYAYGSQGYTHHSIEDLSILRSLPNLDIYSPADVFEVELAVNQILQREKPAYLRLGKGGEANLHTSKLRDSRDPQILTQGNDLVILTTGSIGLLAIEAEKMLRQKGYAVSVISIPILDVNLIEKVLQNLGNIPAISIEENSLPGGFGSFILEVANTLQIQITLHRFGISNQLSLSMGESQYLRTQTSLDTNSLVTQALQILGEKDL